MNAPVQGATQPLSRTDKAIIVFALTGVVLLYGFLLVRIRGNDPSLNISSTTEGYGLISGFVYCTEQLMPKGGWRAFLFWLHILGTVALFALLAVVDTQANP